MTTHGAAPPDSSGLEVLLNDSRASRDEARRRALPLADDERIDPNTSGEEDLDRLPGVGPAVAARIVRTREERGPFAVPSDLLLVPGIGPATLARIAPHLEWSIQPGRGRPRLRSGDSSGSQRGRSTGRLGVDPNSGTRQSAPLDLNRAGREELETLPGVGPVMADRILILREKVGRFRRLEELEAVRGIGPATIERLRPFVVTGG